VYDEYLQQQRFIHFISKPSLELRLLEHFYTFLHFQDRAMDLYYKRFVRDYVHYTALIFCRAALIANSLLREERDGDGGYVAFHIRRGDFQYKEMKLSAEAILANVKPFIPAQTRVVYIATDERNKTFFAPFFKAFPAVRFLDDYMVWALHPCRHAAIHDTMRLLFCRSLRICARSIPTTWG
jgi:hypothetical protein